MKLLRGYPPVLGAMLLVDGVITLILGGDSTVTLGEVVAYLLLPPLAMFLVTRSTGGRRPNAVSLGVGVAGAAVLLAALFLLGGVQLVTMPPWVLALLGAVLLGVALFVMRLSAPAPDEGPVPPLLSPAEREGFGSPSPDESGSPERGEYGSAPIEGYGSAPDDHGRPAEPEWPPSRRDEPSPAGFPADNSTDDTEHGLPRVPGHSAGPPAAEWPPRRDPIGAPWSAGAAPEPAPASRWADNDPPARSIEPAWSDGDSAARPAWSGDSAARPAWSDGDPAAQSEPPGWSSGPADREWPPGPTGAEWPPRRDPEPAPAPEQRSWFDTDDAQPSGSTRSAGPPDSEWPPSERTHQSGRRSRHPDQ